MLQVSARALPADGLETYVIDGGSKGVERLNVLSRALAPTTGALIDRLGRMDGLTVIDAACGGGNVTVQLAKRVGPRGRVVAFDLDPVKLAAAAQLVQRQGLKNCTFMRVDVDKPWPAIAANVVYARFILTHLSAPERLLKNAHRALAPGGTILLEDIDAEGRFFHPPSAAMARLVDLYIAVSRHNGGDPLIGRRLDTLLEASGFEAVGTTLVQPFGRNGDAKLSLLTTFQAIARSVIAAGLATRHEVESLLDAAETYTGRPDTTISMPRIFQAWGTRAR